jgi:hypothetical protein
MMTLQEQFAAQVPAQEVIQRQLAAYNARDIEALLATYHEDAEQNLLHAGPIATGHAAIRKRINEHPDQHPTTAASCSFPHALKRPCSRTIQQ